MKNSAFLIFPIHLFEDISQLENYDTIYLIEEPRYFTDFSFHKLKLAYHRASIKYYFDYLKENLNKEKIIKYINYDEITENWYSDKKYSQIASYEVFDNSLEKKLVNLKSFKFIKSLNFLLDDEIISKKEPVTFMNFYKKQRIRLNVLIDNKEGKHKPLKGVWSFDKENRKKVPKNVDLPPEYEILNNTYIEQAKTYVLEHFPKNYGSLDYFIYPITFEGAKKWLHNFIENLFDDFGPYEDAIVEKNHFLWHSVLAPMMNIGLLTDTFILSEVLKYEDKIRLESLEGFIRQIIGWRNYILTYYICFGDVIRNSNHLNAQNRINEVLYQKLWEGKTGLLPVDNAINGIVKFSYAHHIQRLMILGNFFLLLRIHPDDIYKIFMEWTIDAYDWVMVPNVYSMSQYADGGLMMTRPYFSSSAYITRMSNYKKGPWCETWNYLYYHFLIDHREMLKKNYSTSNMIYHLDKKSESEKDEIVKESKAFAKRLSSI